MNSETNEKIRVLIADDSFFIRTYLSDILQGDVDISVVGTASTGDDVVALVKQMKPDVVTMDYHMPGKNGVEAIADILKGDRPLPAIIMLSAFSGEVGMNVRRNLESSGAHIIVKPSGEVSLDMEKVASEIIKKIKEVGFVGIKMRKAYTRTQHLPTMHEVNRIVTDNTFHGLLVIGASTGGPPLVEHLLGALDPHLGLSVIIVQHMSPFFTKLFAERLSRVTKFPVREAKDGDAFLPGAVVVIPGRHRLSSIEKDEKGLYRLSIKESPEDGCEAEIDTTMITIANCFSDTTIGVLLSGMGRDGTEGLRVIHANRGTTLVQDPQTATISAMPYHAMHETGAEAVSIEKLSLRISECVREKSLSSLAS